MSDPETIEDGTMAISIEKWIHNTGIIKEDEDTDSNSTKLMLNAK